MENKTNKFYSYIRVSTREQEGGASLDEQLRVILDYSKTKGFEIVKEFREVQSASKLGRVKFAKMIHDLEKDESVRGVIFYAVDRSARNPYDQAKLFKLKELGFELHFAVDRMDSTNHSAMSMIFIRWGIASYFSEDHKIKVKMGSMGRIHEGKYPLYAPIGYLNKREAEDMGLKNVETGIKIIDPIRGPLLKKAFTIYSGGEYSVQDMNKILTQNGLRGRGGKPLYWKMLYKVLRNPFYYGYMNYGGILYEGKHRPLITKSLFDKVQKVLEEKANKDKRTYFYLFQGLVQCSRCGRTMRSITAKKKYQYFYCRKQDCGFTGLIHPNVEKEYLKHLDSMSFKDGEVDEFKKELVKMRSDIFTTKEEELKAIEFELTKLGGWLNNLLDRSLADELPEELYKSKKNELTANIATFREKRTALESADDKIFKYLEELGKLLKNPINLYKLAKPEQKRRFIKSMVENLSWDGKKLMIIWKKPFNLVAERAFSKDCGGGGIETPSGIWSDEFLLR